MEKLLKPIIPLIILTSALNIFYVDKGVELIHWGFFRLTTGGLTTAAFIAIRILCLIAGSSLLTYTTSPTTLTDALERLLSPLKALHINVHELSMMMTIALRFIPTLIEETDKIMSAQKARGADMESGRLIQRIKALIPVLIPCSCPPSTGRMSWPPLWNAAAIRAATACTRMKQLHMAARDGWCIAVMVLVAAVMIGLNFVIPAAL